MNFESRNPATGELLGTYPEHDKVETNMRLQRAWDGWRHWSRTPLYERITFLTRLAEDFSVYRGDNQDPAFIEKIRNLASQRQDWPRRVGDDDGYFEVI